MIAILDYDAGNLKSVEKALAYLGEDSKITRNIHEVEKADKLILPGVGSFGAAMEQLKKYEIDKMLQEAAEAGRPNPSLTILVYCTATPTCEVRESSNTFPPPAAA